MGGTGTSLSTAVGVLYYVAGSDSATCTQRWSDDSTTIIGYPAGSP